MPSLPIWRSIRPAWPFVASCDDGRNHLLPQLQSKIQPSFPARTLSPWRTREGTSGTAAYRSIPNQLLTPTQAISLSQTRNYTQSGSARKQFTSHNPLSTPESITPASTRTVSEREPSMGNRLTHLTASGTAHMVFIPPPFSSSTPSSPEGPFSASPSSSSPQFPPAIKPATARLAVARAHVLFSNPLAFSLIRTSSLKKGDVLAVARVAGIMAAKRTSDIVPLCHNIPLSGVEVDVELDSGGISDGSGDATSAFAAKKIQNDTERTMEEEGRMAFGASKAISQRRWEGDVRSDPTHGGVAITATVRTFGQTGVEMEAITAVMGAAATVYDMCKAVDRGIRIEGVRVVLKEGGRGGTWQEPEIVSSAT